MAHRLCDQVSFCLTGGRAVFLDARADRYVCLTGGANTAFRDLLDQGFTAGVGLDGLVRAKLLEEVDTEPPPIRPALAQSARLSLTEQVSAKTAFAIGDVLEAGRQLVGARSRLKQRAFSINMDELRARKARLGPDAATPCDPLVGFTKVFNAARRMVPVKPVCLLDSLALLDFLARRRLSADLVFGVKLNPFAAHCWVQAGDTVLNEAIERVRLHTPILVV